eukprot:scaffold58841_cov19-Tisochrysis_lutea.AAC.3
MYVHSFLTKYLECLLSSCTCSHTIRPSIDSFSCLRYPAVPEAQHVLKQHALIVTSPNDTDHQMMQHAEISSSTNDAQGHTQPISRRDIWQACGEISNDGTDLKNWVIAELPGPPSPHPKRSGLTSGRPAGKHFCKGFAPYKWSGVQLVKIGSLSNKSSLEQAGLPSVHSQSSTF